MTVASGSIHQVSRPSRASGRTPHTLAPGRLDGLGGGLGAGTWLGDDDVRRSQTEAVADDSRTLQQSRPGWYPSSRSTAPASRSYCPLPGIRRPSHSSSLTPRTLGPYRSTARPQRAPPLTFRRTTKLPSPFLLTDPGTSTSRPPQPASRRRRHAQARTSPPPRIRPGGTGSSARAPRRPRRSTRTRRTGGPIRSRRCERSKGRSPRSAGSSG